MNGFYYNIYVESIRKSCKKYFPPVQPPNNGQYKSNWLWMISRIEGANNIFCEGSGAESGPEEGPRKATKAPMTHPSHAHFILFCKGGLPFWMFLSGGRLTTFLDSG